MARQRRFASDGPVRIGRVAETLLDPVVSGAGFSSAQILSAWPDIVGADLAGRTRPERLRWPARRAAPEAEDAGGATLVVRAEGADALELQHLAAGILERINATFGWRAVRRISIRQAPVADPSATAPPPGRRPFPGDVKAAASAGAALGAIEDDGLRLALARLGAGIGDGNTKP